jgi:bacterioferritin-associated ferredoxin
MGVRIRTPSEIFDFSQYQSREIKKVPVETFLTLSELTRMSSVHNACGACGSR